MKSIEKSKTPPPKAEKIPTEFNNFDSKRVDNYYWLKDRKNKAVIDYLEKLEELGICKACNPLETY